MPLIPDNIKEANIRELALKIINGQRISPEEGLILFGKVDLPLLGVLASEVRSRINGKKAYYNRNFHIEPTNCCIYNCKFCSYHKAYGTKDSWEFGIEEMMGIIRQFDNKPVTEVHIVGGVHPKRDLFFYTELIKKIKEHRPELHVKAFTAVEIDYMIKKAGVSLHEGMSKLKEAGLDSIPGGGAEIFNESIRKEICGEKSSAPKWLSIHKTAHELGIPSNATMLYGHIENYGHRIDHLSQLRDLQDITGGFNAFIPLKFKSENNSMSYLGEVSIIEDLRNFAVSRIFLDNIPHIKAYWPMTGKDMARITLFFGADDLDGTIEDTTKIYSLAGAEDKNPSMTSEEIKELIENCGFIPVERDSLYNEI